MTFTKIPEKTALDPMPTVNSYVQFNPNRWMSPLSQTGCRRLLRVRRTSLKLPVPFDFAQGPGHIIFPRSLRQVQAGVHLLQSPIAQLGRRRHKLGIILHRLLLLPTPYPL